MFGEDNDFDTVLIICVLFYCRGGNLVLILVIVIVIVQEN